MIISDGGSGVATGVVRGGRVPPLTSKKKCQKSGKRAKKNQKKSGKNQKKLGKKRKNREVSFTLPLVTDRAGYATGWRSLKSTCYRFINMICRLLRLKHHNFA